MLNQLTVSLWGDESFSVVLAKHNLFDIIRITAQDFTPPLYYFFLHGWMQLFGTSEIAVRSLSLLFFLLIPLALFYLAKDFFGKKIALLASGLVLLYPFLFGYAFEARAYTLLTFLTTLSMAFFLKKRWTLYVITTVAALYTHNFTVFIILAQILYFLVALRKEWRSILLSFVGIGLLYLPWMTTIYQQVTRVNGDFWIDTPTWDTLKNMYKTFFVFYWTTITIFILRGYKRKEDLLLYLWLLVPPFASFFLSLVGRPLFYDRYLIEIIPAIPLLLASGLYYQTKKISLFKRLRQIAIAVLILYLGFNFINKDIHKFSNPNKQPFRELAAYITGTYPTEIPVINYYTDKLHYFELKYYDIPVVIYSPNELPYWVGKSLIDPQDNIQQFPEDKPFLIVASGKIEEIQLPPSLIPTTSKQFGDLWLFEYNQQ